MPDVYFDTAVIRLLGQALNAPLPRPLREHICLALSSAAEVIAQLAAGNGDEVFACLQAMHRWLPEKYVMLPWPDALIAQRIFGLACAESPVREKLSAALEQCLKAESPEQARAPACEVADVWPLVRREAAEAHRQTVLMLRKGPFNERDLFAMFARALAERFSVTLAPGSETRVVAAIEAYLQFQAHSLWAAVVDPKYNFFSPKHLNDQLEAEQLVYLAYPNLYFVTTSPAYRRARNTRQCGRIHIEQAGVFENEGELLALLSCLAG